jgi:hypothetical protein
MFQNNQSYTPKTVAPLVGVLFGIAALFTFVIFHGLATIDDMSGEQLTYKGCTVTKNSETNVKGVVLYDLRTTCGDFKPAKEMRDEMQVDGTYDLTTTVGNWANPPTVLSVEVSAK